MNNVIKIDVFRVMNRLFFMGLRMVVQFIA